MKNMGDGRRKLRVEKEVQEIVSAFVIRHLRHDLPGLVTITRVTMPSDFRTAQVYLSYYANEGSQDVDASEVLQSWASEIQNEIGNVMKMRYCPKLTFYNDETTEKILKIERILSDISVAKDPNAAKLVDEDTD